MMNIVTDLGTELLPKLEVADELQDASNSPINMYLSFL